MRNLWLTVTFIAVVGAASFGAFFLKSREALPDDIGTDANPVAWMQTEFGLSDAQLASIGKIHDDYMVVCGEHCSEILAARARGASADEIAAIESECVSSMTSHFREVAALLPAGQGARYLDLVLPRVAAFDHRTPVGLEGR